MTSEREIRQLADRGIFALQSEGGSQSATVVFAHGINADHTEDRSDSKPGIFDLIVDGLDARGIRTLRFDFRGHGRSSKVDGGVSLESERDDIDTVLNYIGDDRGKVLAVVGCSFGASAAIHLASRAEVKGILLLNPVIRPRETFLEPGSDWAHKSFTPEAVRRADGGGILMLDGDLPLGRAFLRSVRSADLVSDLQRLTAPTLFIHGTRDTYVPFGYTEEVATLLKRSLVRVDGSEHGFGKLDDRRFVSDVACSFVSWCMASANGG